MLLASSHCEINEEHCISFFSKLLDDKEQKIIYLEKQNELNQVYYNLFQFFIIFFKEKEKQYLGEIETLKKQLNIIDVVQKSILIFYLKNVRTDKQNMEQKLAEIQKQESAFPVNYQTKNLIQNEKTSNSKIIQKVIIIIT